jgi:hypothetical protein
MKALIPAEVIEKDLFNTWAEGHAGQGPCSSLWCKTDKIKRTSYKLKEI